MAVELKLGLAVQHIEFREHEPKPECLICRATDVNIHCSPEYQHFLGTVVSNTITLKSVFFRS